ncbi:MAG: hypothetical protein MI810_18790 [Flavobacteriales bacterium]|nr:hypothetical protein [Flavobacteriales bacterium]
MKNLKNYILGAFAIVALISCEKEEINEDAANNGTKESVKTGIGGSMAQFTIIDDYLYTVDYKTLKVFHLANAENPTLLETIDMGIGMETIFPQDDKLFIGAQDGVHIYDVSNPRSPEEVSTFEHVTSCDPVIANEQYAFATLRGGTECGGNLSELDILDISNLSNPTVVATSELLNPYGLGFSNTDENIIYVCDGYAGLKAYDISDLSDIQVVMENTNLEAVDVIPSGDDLLVVLTKQGVYQFDSSDPINLVERSFIPVQ